MVVIKHKKIQKIQGGLGLVGALVIVLRSLYSWNPSVPACYYFTVMSNIACVTYWLWTGVTGRKVSSLIHMAVTLNMLITGMVFSTLIQGPFAKRLYLSLEQDDISLWVYWVSRGASFFTHYLFPIAITVDFMLLCPLIELRPKDLKKVLIGPVVYSIFHSLFGLASGQYLYPFLSPHVLGGWWQVLGVIVVLTAFFILVLSLLYRLKRLMDEQLKSRFYNQTFGMNQL